MQRCARRSTVLSPPLTQRRGGGGAKTPQSTALRGAVSVPWALNMRSVCLPCLVALPWPGLAPVRWGTGISRLCVALALQLGLWGRYSLCSLLVHVLDANALGVLLIAYLSPV